MRIGFYPGCSLTGSARDYNESVLAVAEALGIELVQIPDWNCCGATAAHNLNHDLSLALPARILSLAEQNNMEEVVVPFVELVVVHRSPGAARAGSPA
jgi:heterodisulfide reductase subunit B